LLVPKAAIQRPMSPSSGHAHNSQALAGTVTSQRQIPCEELSHPPAQSKFRTAFLRASIDAMCARAAIYKETPMPTTKFPTAMHFLQTRRSAALQRR